MLDGYIRKQDVLNLSQSIERNFRGEIAERSIDVKDVEALKPADVVQVVHAYWIPQKVNYGFKEVLMRCSVCGYLVSRLTGNANFCPNCGAKMDAR